MLKLDNIKEIQIDDLGRLRVYPEQQAFTFIWRSATEVHWDDLGFLYSPKPREWSYLNWYQHILKAIKEEYNYDLLLTPDTVWVNVPTSLKEEISST